MELKPRQEDLIAFSSHVATRRQDAMRAEKAARAQAEIDSRKERYSDVKQFLQFAAKEAIDIQTYHGHNKECLTARATSWQTLLDHEADSSELTVECRFVQLTTLSTRLDHSSQKVRTRSDHGIIEIRSVNHQEEFEGKSTRILTLFPDSLVLTGPDNATSPFYDIHTQDQDKKVIIDDVIETVLTPLRVRLFSEDPSLAAYCMEE